VTDPGFRGEAFDQVRSIALRQLTQSASVPMGVLQLNMPSLVHSADARWATPTPDSVSAAKADELKGLFAYGLTHNSLEITVVGDITAEQGIDAVAATLGAIPARSAATPGNVEGVRFPHGEISPVVLRHRGAADQGVAAIGWPTTDAFSDIRQIPVRQVLSEIMTARLFDAVRAAAGAAYSPHAFAQSSMTFRDYGFLLALADVPPSKTAVFYDAVTKITQDLKSSAVANDELDRARTPALAKLTQAQQTNSYWLGSLSQIQSDARHLDLVRQSLINLQAVSAADIQQAANRYLVDAAALTFMVEPADSP
jgi:zinc protease